MSDQEYLSRSIDYLGNLGSRLRDLQGYDTLAYELIQNADDARNANEMIFDVREDSVVVDNNGVFADCGEPNSEHCPWINDSDRKHKCDFHRFRLIMSGDKREQSGTTGAFGIGFLTVLQITDRPELISANRHWMIQEDNSENKRIAVCSGCAECSAKDLPCTRFIFPWARDPQSKLPKEINVGTRITRSF